MTTVIQNITSDAYVIQASPAYNSGSSTVLTLTSTAGSAGRQSYVYFNRPFPLGYNIISAKLRLYQKGVAAGGARILTVRRVTAAWKESTLTWTNRPTVTGTTVSSPSQTNGGVDGRLWEMDITALMQTVADGAAWYGLRVESDNATRLDFFSSEAGDFNPEMEIEFTDAPDKPTVLAPSAGRAVSIARPTLRFDFTDTAGDTTMIAYQVQINTADVWTAPLIDTGTVSSDTPEYLLTADTPVATLRYWRVRVQDGAGLWSPWSDAETFTRTAKPTVTINNPTTFVSEATPPISWTVTGGTQTAYQVFITDPTNTSIIVWTSGKFTSTATTVTVPEKLPPYLTPGSSYGLTVRIWDSAFREATPGDPVYTDAALTFSFNLSNTVAVVTGLTVTTAAGAAVATASWSDATAPDYYMVTVDGVSLVSNLVPATLFVSGTSYSYKLTTLSPRKSHTISVFRIVNGVTSTSNPTATITTLPEGLWLSTLDGLHTVSISGDDPLAFQASELSVVRKPVGAKNPVLITQAVYGREGRVDGYLGGRDDTYLAATLVEWDAIMNRKTYPRGTPMSLVESDTSMRVFIYNVARGFEDGEFIDSVPVTFDYCELT